MMASIENKLKRTMIITAIDIILKDAHNSPIRCSKNLIELGKNAYPSVMTRKELRDVRHEFIILCKNHEIPKLKDFFLLIFDTEDN